MYTIGWECLFLFKSSMKKGLDDARTTLWASICCPSPQARVTSVKSLSSLSSLNEEVMFSLKSFHWRHSFSEVAIIRVIVCLVVQCKTPEICNSRYNYQITKELKLLNGNMVILILKKKTILKFVWIFRYFNSCSYVVSGIGNFNDFVISDWFWNFKISEYFQIFQFTF